MKITYIEIEHRETRPWEFGSVGVALKIGASLDEGDDVETVRAELDARVRQETICSADEALAEYIMRVQAQKAGN